MERRRLIWNSAEYEVIASAKLNGECRIETGLIIDSTYIGDGYFSEYNN
jgi:hypothetical protein